MKVDLNHVIEAIELEGELLTHYYNKNTGVIIYVEDPSTSSYKAEDIENINSFEEWEQELIRELNNLKQNPEDYIQLPDINELDEYKVMVQFSKTIDKLEIKATVRELKEEVEKRGYLNNWYQYREDFECNIAKKWCADNGIEY